MTINTDGDFYLGISMEKLTTFLLLASCTGLGSHAAASGIAYQNSVKTTKNSHYYIPSCMDYYNPDDPDDYEEEDGKELPYYESD